MPNIKNVTVIGTGVIGAGWIIRCLAHNKKVVAYDKPLERSECKIMQEDEVDKLIDLLSHEAKVI